MLHCNFAIEGEEGTLPPRNQIGYLSYLGEGAANAVFRIQQYAPFTDFVKVYFSDNDGNPMDLPLDSLLRFPKNNVKTISAKDTICGLKDYVIPHFNHEAKHILPHELVSVSRSVLSAADILLRKQKRRLQSGSIMPLDEDGDSTDCFAILIQDMSSVDGRSLTIEFKPKWLVNSPLQKRLSYRCRTCAMRAYQLSNDGINRSDSPTMCPLDLLMGKEDVIRAFVRSSMKEKLGYQDDTILDALTFYLAKGEGHDLIKFMADLQMFLDPDYEGFENDAIRTSEELADQHRRLAMTVRDCSMYVRIWYTKEPYVIECALADMDFKHEDKIPDWEAKENMLKNGGWYTGKENNRDTFDLTEQCALARYLRRNVPWMW